MSGTGNIWITSDTHFDHSNIVHLANRPFDDVQHMNNEMIERWNSVVRPKDTIWHLGDFGMGGKASDLGEIFHSLHGYKHLVLGNHDEAQRRMLKFGWESIQYYKKLQHNKQKYILCHYPFASWNGQTPGRIHFHGHCHGNLTTKLPRRYDVGVDVWDFYPQNLEELADKIRLWDDDLEVYEDRPGSSHEFI